MDLKAKTAPDRFYKAPSIRTTTLISRAVPMCSRDSGIRDISREPKEKGVRGMNKRAEND